MNFCRRKLRNNEWVNDKVTAELKEFSWGQVEAHVAAAKIPKPLPLRVKVLAGLALLLALLLALCAGFLLGYETHFPKSFVLGPFFLRGPSIKSR